MNSEKDELILEKNMFKNLYWFDSNYITLYCLKQKKGLMNLLIDKNFNFIDNYFKIEDFKEEVILHQIPDENFKFKEDVSLRFLILKTGAYVYELTKRINKNDSKDKKDRVISAIGISLKGFLEIYSSLLEEISYIQIGIARLLELNGLGKFNSFKDINKLFIRNKENVTYEEGIENLIKSSYKVTLDTKKYKKLIYKIEELERNIKNSDIKNFRFGYDKEGDFSFLEKEINNAFLVEIINKIGFLVSIKEAAETTKINENTIKKACQNNELLNKRKVGKTWLVDCNEIKKHWENNNIEK
ncbi:MAG: helix-turn-helix domain-containing protein [Clostridium sp.]|nr:helix-turn-helix domain-containing protein [Clostridium sp.]